MRRWSKIGMWVALVLIGALTAMSVYGAFLGAARAQAFFNSLPLVIYWIILLLGLCLGFVWYPRLVRKPALLLMHAGCVLILAGAMWGSEMGHRLQKRYLNIDKAPQGAMVIFEGHTENRIFDEQTRQILAQLPFDLYLDDFRIEYYPSSSDFTPRLLIMSTEGQHDQLPAQVGAAVDLGPAHGRIEIIRVFGNLKVATTDKGPQIEDQPGDDNPAVQVIHTTPDGTVSEHYIFARHAGHEQIIPNLRLMYQVQGSGPVKDYISDLAVVQNGAVVARHLLEVNKPLHFGGYHFYQSSFDTKQGTATILQVVSDSGLKAVMIGFLLLLAGTMGHFWLGPLNRAWTRRAEHAD